MKYTIGADYGTLSVRSLLVEVETGREVCSAEKVYPHGVMTEKLPDGSELPADYALQDPMDYLDGLRETVQKLIAESGVDPADVIGLALDCTADTCVPVDRDNVPLCRQKRFSGCPHAWVKLWKHHGAEQEARDIRIAAEKADPGLLDQYGGQVFSEWMLPKLLETCRKAPEIIENTDRFLQIGDWIVSVLTGSTARSASHAGFKNFRSEKGYPPADFLRSLHPLLDRFEELNRGELLIPGTKAGELTAKGAALIGLREGTAVAVSGTDAFHPMPALGLTDSGDFLMSIGTSTCHIMVNTEYVPFAGICGVVKDGIIPGLYGYEAGQSATGDLFDWVVRRMTPKETAKEAEEKGVSLHALLTEKAARLRPGQSGLMVLDWWNGCRSPLMNAKLSGLLLGMTLETKPEEIYRAAIEACAYATRMIADNFRDHGVPVKRAFACGGISRKNPLLMQIYADVLGMEIRVSDSSQAAALGSAVFAAAAAGSGRGGFASVREASEKMKCGASVIYTPDPVAGRMYDALYREYVRLAETFGKDPESVMARVRALKDLAAGKTE